MRGVKTDQLAAHVVPAAMHRLNNFDLIRILAALCVLVSHQHALTGLPEPNVLHAESLGGLGVVIFFSISGFLVAQSWDADPHLWRFAARRLLRIWPALAVVTLLAALVLGPLVSSQSPRQYFSQPEVISFAWNLVFDLRDQLPLQFTGSALPAAVNSSLWTIALELKCYVALVVVGFFGLLRNRALLPIFTTLVAPLTYLVGEPIYRNHPELVQFRVDQVYLLHFSLYFFAGASIYQLRFDSLSRWKLLLVVAGLWSLGGVALAFGKPLLTLWLLIPISVALAGQASTPYLRRASRFGDLSYGLYIYAFPVQQTLIWQLRDRMSWGMMLTLSIGTTTMLAFASWHLVEKRAMRLKPSKPTG